MHRGPSNGRLAHMVGTLVYMAPEVLQGEPHGLAADVYAFAVTFNEVAAAAVPYVDCELPVPELHTVLETRFNEVSLRRAIVKDMLRPAMADRVPPQFSAIIADAWHPDPQRRPSIGIVLQKLKAIASMGTPHLSQFTAAIGGDISFDDRQAIGSSTPPHQPALSTGKDANINLLKELQFFSIGPPLPVWYKQCSALEKTTAAALLSSTTTKKSPVNPRILAAISSTPGGRGADRMEDRSFVHSDVLGMVGTHLMAVFDGHGGSSCSQFALEVLPSALYRAWTRPEATPVSALVRAFQDTDTAFLTVSPLAEQSGCTALATLVVDSMLYVANAGDCRCVLGLRDGTSQVLTKDHVALDADERARIEARGGTVDPISGRLEGRLIVSRAFGDRCLKRYISATPDVTTVPLSPAHDFFIVASDGLWDVVSSADASALVRSTARSPDLAARRLALKAIELGSDDNISVIVALLDWDTGMSVRQAIW
jgi:serine/threonine protein phosphatase PrpC